MKTSVPLSYWQQDVTYEKLLAREYGSFTAPILPKEPWILFLVPSPSRHGDSSKGAPIKSKLVSRRFLNLWSRSGRQQQARQIQASSRQNASRSTMRWTISRLIFTEWTLMKGN